MSEYTAEMAHEAAARGAAWLDKQCPNWIHQIDLGDAYCCVLGQTAKCLLGDESNEPGFDRVWGAGLMTNDELGQRGFDSTGHDAEFEMLTIAWKEIIRERLAAEVKS